MRNLETDGMPGSLQLVCCDVVGNETGNSICLLMTRRAGTQMTCKPKYDRSKESSSIRTNNNEMMKELTVGKLVLNYSAQLFARRETIPLISQSRTTVRLWTIQP